MCNKSVTCQEYIDRAKASGAYGSNGPDVSPKEPTELDLKYADLAYEVAITMSSDSNIPVTFTNIQLFEAALRLDGCSDLPVDELEDLCMGEESEETVIAIKARLPHLDAALASFF